MKYVKCITIALIIIVSMLSVACSSNKSNKVSNNDVQHLYYPEWWDLQDDPEFVFVFGEGTKSTSSLAKNAAYSNAMLDAANFVEAHVKGMIKNFEEESGVNDPQVLALTSKVVKVVANTTFNGVRISKSEMIKQKDSKIKSFVRISIPQNEINKTTVDAIKNEEALYNEFKASQRFDELEKEISKQ